MLRFTITRKHWDQAVAIEKANGYDGGRFSRRCHCPSALALWEALDRPIPVVTHWTDETDLGVTMLFVLIDGEVYPLPEAMKKVILAFDSRGNSEWLPDEFPGDQEVEIVYGD